MNENRDARRHDYLSMLGYYKKEGKKSGFFSFKDTDFYILCYVFKKRDWFDRNHILTRQTILGWGLARGPRRFMLDFGMELEKRSLGQSTAQSPMIEGLHTYTCLETYGSVKKKKGSVEGGRSRFGSF
jgi:hypothetical protein